MTSYSFSNDFSFYGERVLPENLLPSHKKQLARSISNYISNLPCIEEYWAFKSGKADKKQLATLSNYFSLDVPSLKEYLGSNDFNFRALISKDTAVLRQGSNGIGWHVPEEKDDLKQIQRIARYYQNLGYVKRDLSKDIPLNTPKNAIPFIAGAALERMKPAPSVKNKI